MSDDDGINFVLKILGILVLLIMGTAILAFLWALREWIVCLFVWIALGCVGAGIATRKGRDRGFFGLWVLVSGPVGLVCALIATEDQEGRKRIESERKRAESERKRAESERKRVNERNSKRFKSPNWDIIGYYSGDKTLENAIWRKQCPYCAEWVKEQAIKCRYCQSYLSGKIPHDD